MLLGRFYLTTVQGWIDRGRCQCRWDHLFARGLLLRRDSSCLTLLLLLDEFLEKLAILKLSHASNLPRRGLDWSIIALRGSIDAI